MEEKETQKEAYDCSSCGGTVTAGDFRGTPVGIDVTRVVESGIVPVVNTGIAHREPGIGMVGAGLVKPPLACFEQALSAYCEHYKEQSR